MSDAPLLEMRGIAKRFGGVAALKGVTIDVLPGEVVALIGENGAGKSTLMKILGGVQTSDEGQIFIEGKPVSIASVTDATRLGIGFIHQELSVLDNLDVAGNVFLGREPTRFGPLKLIDSSKMYADTQPFLDRLGLAVSSRTPLSSLSIAQRQLVEIARALSLNARLIIMDEPTSSLTLTETERLLETVLEIKAAGVSVIYISHRLGEIARIADRVTGLRDGANAGGLTREEITHDHMVSLMIGREISRQQAAGADVTPGFFRVENLKTRRYPNQSVTFEIGAGEILGMAGLVGAGRSEVAQAVFGVDPPLAGSLTLDKKPIKVRQPSDAIERGIYLVPEDRRNSGVILDMPIRENVTLPALERYSSFGLVNGGREREAAQRDCTALGVKTASIDNNVGTLSGGNQQKVVLAKWLSLSPRVMIFDEPTRGIDVGAKAEIYALMRNLAREGVAILMISSDMEEVLGVSDRIAVMHEGRLTGFLTRAESSEQAVMQLAVGGRKEAA